MLDQAVERGAFGLAGGDDEADDEILERRREVDAVGGGLGGMDGGGAEAGGGGGRGVAALGLDEIEDGALGLGAGEDQGDVEEEAVELGLGQREGALVLDRVLGGDDHERVGERPGGAAGGDLALGHRLEEGGLDLRAARG